MAEADVLAQVGGLGEAMEQEDELAPASDEGPDEALPDAVGHFFARYGTFLLIIPGTMMIRKGPDMEKIQSDLIAALRADSRVESVDARPLRPDWSRIRPMYPLHRRSETGDFLSGRDKLPALRMSDPIEFQIRVPKKNQPKFRNVDDVPSDCYWVAWDGFTVVILWERGEGERLPPKSGGHIIHDVLNTATKRAGFSVVQQACSPGCTNMFAHRVLRVVQYPAGHQVPSFVPRGFPVVETSVSVDGGPGTVVEALAPALLYCGERFAVFKNYARRALDTEAHARNLVSNLLELDYQSLIERRDNWLVRGWRRFLRIWQRPERSSRELIASLWLAMSRIEIVAGDANKGRSIFLDSISRDGRNHLYDVDRKSDEEQLESLNVDFIRAAIEQKSRGIDTKVIALATASGAVAALIGALVGRLGS